MSQPPGTAPRRPQVFRRRTTVAFAFILTGVIVCLAVVLTIGEYGHGIFPLLAAPAGALPLVVLVLVTGAWPHVTVGMTGVQVRNAFVGYDVPYPAIVEARQTRMGLLIHTNDRSPIPVTAFTSGSMSKTLGHASAATLVVNAIDNAREFVPPDERAVAIRRVDIRTVIAVIASIVIAVVVIYIAAHTYH